MEAKEKINHVQNQVKVVYVLPMASLILSFHIRKKESLTILTKHLQYNFPLVEFIEKYPLPIITIQTYYLFVDIPWWLGGFSGRKKNMECNINPIHNLSMKGSKTAIFKEKKQ